MHGVPASDLRDRLAGLMPSDRQAPDHAATVATLVSVPRTPPRARASSAVEWLLAAAAIVGALWAVAGWLRPERGAASVGISGEAPALPAGVPAGASSTALVIFEDGAELRTGMTESEALAVLAAAGAPAGPEQPAAGRRLRAFTRGRTHGYLVVEPGENGRPPRVAALYLR